MHLLLFLSFTLADVEHLKQLVIITLASMIRLLASSFDDLFIQTLCKQQVGKTIQKSSFCLCLSHS
jgi:hypothetical protein